MKSLTMRAVLTKGFMDSAALLALLLPAMAISQVRTQPSPAEESKAPVEHFPSASFDQLAATRALDRGSATIQGIACSYHGGLMFVAKNSPVMLFPATPYYKEWMQMRKQMNGKELVVMSSEAFQTRIDTKTDDGGNFRFSEIKPGRYIVVVQQSFTEARAVPIYAGTAVNSYGDSADYYRNEDRSISHNDELIGDVVVKKEGDVSKATLAGGKMTLAARMLPCR